MTDQRRSEFPHIRLLNLIPTIEQHVEWIADCIDHTMAGNHAAIEATAEAEAAWWNHVQEAGAVGLKATTDSWYVGANVEGKPRVFLPYIGGFPEIPLISRSSPSPPTRRLTARKTILKN